jgi:DNA-binding CsgD family transcriptional regulator
VDENAGMGQPPDVLEAARVALRDGRWAAALAAFREALAEEESPEALEGLSWAAWWLDDADTVFEAREGAFERYRAAGDAAGAARMATWLAADQLDFRGAAAVATGWLRRARRLLEPLEPGPEHGWLAFHEAYVAHVGGDAARAGELSARAAELGRRLGVPDLEMLGLALEGATLVARARVEEGMACLDEATATALAGTASVPISRAWTCCFLVSACTTVLDYERAAAWCDRIAEFAERYGSRYMLAFCGAGYGGIELWRGRWREAEAVLEAAVRDSSRSRPVLAAGPLATLAELRRRQGRRADAEALLERAGTAPAAQLCRARLALDEDDAGTALELLERLLRRAGDERRLDAAPALGLVVRARVARADLDAAAAAVAELRALARLAGTAPLRAHADLAEGLYRAARGEHEPARALLEDAVERFADAGAPFEAAEARVALAASLAAGGRGDAAAREATAACDALDALGAAPAAARARRLLASGGGGGALPLTPRERDVLELLAGGLTNQQIAERLVLSEHTVHRHVANILRKLDVPSRAAAVATAARAGLLGRA